MQLWIQCVCGRRWLPDPPTLPSWTRTYNFYMEKYVRCFVKIFFWRMKLYLQCPVLCLVAQSCPILCNPMDCSPPGSSVHRGSPGKHTGVGCHALLQGIFLTQGLNPGGFFIVWAREKILICEIIEQNLTACLTKQRLSWGQEEREHEKVGMVCCA